VAGDVAMAGMAGPDVTQDLPAADDRVTPAVGVPTEPQASERPAASEPHDADGSANAQHPDETAREPRADGAGNGRASGASRKAGSHRKADGTGNGRASGVSRKSGSSRKASGGDVKAAARSAASRVTRRPAQAAGGPAGSEGPSGAAAVRRRLARLGAARGGAVNPVLEPLIKIVRSTHPKADVRLIERAYELAAAMHAGQSRNSGDPFITHPLAVATILAELGMPHDVISAALLHDTVEDTAYTIDQLRADFGDDIGSMVDGVTKLDKVKYGEAAEAETVRKMVVAMSRDIRVLVIKLADRLHNMRTLRYLPREKQERKSREVLEIYAPLAHRLGMNTVKWELEDLAFATLYPKRYDEIARLVSERAPRREAYLREVKEDIEEDLRDAKVKSHVTQALLLGVPEDDRPQCRLRRHLRPGGDQGPGRLASRLLRGPRHRARAVESGSRPVQGLHRDAEVQHVSVAAHDRDRP